MQGDYSHSMKTEHSGPEPLYDIKAAVVNGVETGTSLSTSSRITLKVKKKVRRGRTQLLQASAFNKKMPYWLCFISIDSDMKIPGG